MNIKKGNIVQVFYYQQNEFQLSKKQREDNRTKAMGGELEATLNKLLYGQATRDDLVQSISRGWNTAKKLDTQRFLNTQNVWIQIGYEDSIQLINRIEKDETFAGWLDPILIEDIKKYGA